MNIGEHFNRYFKIETCRSIETIKKCQHLRYMAYCEEHHYLNTSDFPDELEADQYDESSEHILISHRESGQTTATVRMILCGRQPEIEKFPIENFSILRRMKRDMPWRISREYIGEISRFSISKTFRRRIEESKSIHGITETTFYPGRSGKRYVADITLGLFRGVVMSSARYKLTHWYALMEPALIRLLSRSGIKFNMVGPVVEFYGERQPCIASIEDVLQGIYSHDESIWRFITDEGLFYPDSKKKKKSQPQKV